MNMIIVSDCLTEPESQRALARKEVDAALETLRRHGVFGLDTNGFGFFDAEKSSVRQLKGAGALKSSH
jgi:hypothetical protein